MNISDLISVLEGFKEIDVTKVYIQDYNEWKAVKDFQIRIVKDESDHEEIELSIGF